MAKAIVTPLLPAAGNVFLATAKSDIIALNSQTDEILPSLYHDDNQRGKKTSYHPPPSLPASLGIPHTLACFQKKCKESSTRMPRSMHPHPEILVSFPDRKVSHSSGMLCRYSDHRLLYDSQGMAWHSCMRVALGFRFA